MFPFQMSKTTEQPLENVLTQLSRHPLVDGILLTGSTAKQTAHANSDYDMVCVMKNLPKNMLGITTFIEGKFAEVFLYSPEEVERVTNMKIIDASAKEGWIVHWVRSGRIIVDKSGRLGRLKEKSTQISDGVTDTLTYQSWHRMNYNFVQNLRYFRTENELYLQALDIRLSWSIVEVLTGYFNVRKIPWRGEKEALVWLREHDGDFLVLYQSFFTQINRSEKMRIYTDIVRVVLEPVDGMWQGPTTSVVPTGETDEATIQAGLQFWNDLLT